MTKQPENDVGLSTELDNRNNMTEFAAIMCRGLGAAAVSVSVAGVLQAANDIAHNAYNSTTGIIVGSGAGIAAFLLSQARSLDAQALASPQSTQESAVEEDTRPQPL